jgi:hypothetical protein
MRPTAVPYHSGFAGGGSMIERVEASASKTIDKGEIIDYQKHAGKGLPASSWEGSDRQTHGPSRGTWSRQVVDKHVFAGEMGARQVDDVAMVREEQYLSSSRQLGQSFESGGCSEVVEI